MNKYFLLVLVFVLVSTPVFGGGRERYQAPRAWGRSKNYRTYDRRGYNYNHNYRRYEDPISKDLRRVSYGVGIAADIVGLYNEVRYGGRSETVVVQQQPVVVQQQQPIVIQQTPPPVIWQTAPVIIRPSVIIIR